MAEFLVRSLASLILRECLANTLFLANIRPAPPPPNLFFLLPLFSSLLFTRIYFLLLSLFLRFLPPPPTEFGSDLASEDDAVTTVAAASVPAVVSPVVVSPVVVILPPLQFSLLNASKTPPKFLFIFDHPGSPCRSVVAPTPKLSDQRYSLKLVVIPC